MTVQSRRRGGSLARGGALLGVASVLANALGYGLTVVFARAFGPAEYGAATCDVSVGSVLLVEANPAPAQSLREVALFESLAGRLPVAGIVAYVDLTDVAGRDAALDALAARVLTVHALDRR
jgi:hypothetical protein